LAADTIVPQPQNPQNLNRYSYVGNQPLGFIDPSGHAAICGTSADDGCGGIDALQSIEMQLRRGGLDPIGAKQAYYQYYLAHPGEDAGAYQSLNPTEEFNGIISTGYAQAQAELGAANLGGLALGAATTNGVIFEAMSGYGGNAALGMMAMVGGIGTGGSICLNCGTVKPDLARSSGKLRIDPDGASVYCTNCLQNGQTQAGPNKYWVKSFESYESEALQTDLGLPEYTPQHGRPGHFSVFQGGPTDENSSLWQRLNQFIRTPKPVRWP
ncbi:MAG: hypothetical protein WA077_03170, partial [Anaerolineae bacterium]